jgi:hypothetical protein
MSPTVPIIYNNKNVFLEHKPSVSINPNNSRYEKFAEWICSRESLFRFGLDCSGWILPTVIGGALRNKFSFYESLFQTGLEVFGMGFATSITKLAGKISAFFHLNPEDKKNFSNLVLFTLNDLDSPEKMQSSASRIMTEEINDLNFMSGMSNHSPNKKINSRANEINHFFSNFKSNPQQLERLKKFKRSMILIDSTFQSILWGGYMFYNRLFRKYVLGQDRFTGTKAYASNEESKKVGDSTPLSLVQKMGIGFSMFSAPLMNFCLFKYQDSKNTQTPGKNSWLQMIKNQWDTTHGFYPKLGLLWSYCFVPVSLGSMFAAQGKSELIENALTQLTMGNSWFFGHRLTNGVLAKFFDKKITKNHNVAPGVLVDPEYLHHPFPEPAKIQHIINRTQNNPALEKDARRSHANILYSGFLLHSSLVLGIRLLINMFTKWRVEKSIGK